MKTLQQVIMSVALVLALAGCPQVSPIDLTSSWGVVDDEMVASDPLETIDSVETVQGVLMSDPWPEMDQIATLEFDNPADPAAGVIDARFHLPTPLISDVACTPISEADVVGVGFTGPDDLLQTEWVPWTGDTEIPLTATLTPSGEFHGALSLLLQDGSTLHVNPDLLLILAPGAESISQGACADAATLGLTFPAVSSAAKYGVCAAMPDLRSLTVAQATTKLNALNIRLRVISTWATPDYSQDGKVRSQSPAPYSNATYVTEAVVVVYRRFPDGWVTTGETTKQQEVVSRAAAYPDFAPSPQSATAADGVSGWQTDIASVPNIPGSDGSRMLSAAQTYAAWYRNPAGVSLATVKTKMGNTLYTYPAGTVRNALVDRIVARYNTTRTLPANAENAMLSWLQIRAQCMEFAMRTGRTCTSYYTAGNKTVPAVDVPYVVRPGMLLYNLKIHAMVIEAVLFSGGRVVAVKVAESNNGTGWANPGGQVPWERTIRHGRPINVPFPSNYVVIDTEK